MLRHPWFRRQNGFTLIELMIVVAIIGILAALAIPNFVRLQLRTKSAEGRLNLAGIRKAEDGYFAEVGVFLSWSSTPQVAGSPPGASKREWGVQCSTPPTSSSPGFCLIGWAPEGDVYFNYAVETNGGSVALNAAQFFAAAEADIDNDGLLNLWGLKKADNSGAVMSTGPYGCNDVLGASGQPATGQIGPCDEPTNGINIF